MKAPTTEDSDPGISLGPTTGPLAPFFRWVGGKGRIVAQVLAHFPLAPLQGRYIDPTLGGGTVPIRLIQMGRVAPQQMVLSDLNQDLITCWQSVTQNPALVLEHLAATKHWDFPTVKGWEPQDPYDWSARFLHLQARSFNGLWRENRAGIYNVACDHSKRGRLVDPYKLLAVGQALKGASFQVLGAIEAIGAAQAGDWLYCDPPYHGTFTGYCKGGLQDGDQVRLAEALRAAAERGSFVATSNADTPLIRDLYQSFEIHEIVARRSINCDGGGRGNVVELLMTRGAC